MWKIMSPSLRGGSTALAEPAIVKKPNKKIGSKRMVRSITGGYMRNRYFWLLGMLVFTVSGCNKGMTYQEFLNKFQQNCPRDHVVGDLEPLKAHRACNCMLRTTVEKWPNMATLLTAMPILDRSPRGEADFVPSTIRMAAPYCLKEQ